MGPSEFDKAKVKTRMVRNSIVCPCRPRRYDLLMKLSRLEAVKPYSDCPGYRCTSFDMSASRLWQHVPNMTVGRSSYPLKTTVRRSSQTTRPLEVKKRVNRTTETLLASSDTIANVALRDLGVTLAYLAVFLLLSWYASDALK